MKFTLSASNKASLHEAIDRLDLTRNWQFEWHEQKSRRSLEQNAIMYAWYSEIAQALDSDNAEGWKCYCKLHFGVPIMRRDDAKFRQVYDEAIKGLSYEKKLQIMRILPVTSLMNTAQLSEYLEHMQAYFMDKNVMLDFPKEG